jgi:hypothetical protein
MAGLLCIPALPLPAELFIVRASPANSALRGCCPQAQIALLSEAMDDPLLAPVGLLLIQLPFEPVGESSGGGDPPVAAVRAAAGRILSQ